MRKGSRDSNLDFFKKKCRENGLKITPQRTVVYEELAKSNQHLGADAVFRLVREKFPHISLETVNRTLLTFHDICLVNVVETIGGPRRYDPDLSPHHHFCCVGCDEIIDFQAKECDEIDIPEQIKKKCTVHTKRVVITGLCEKCSKR